MPYTAVTLGNSWDGSTNFGREVKNPLAVRFDPINGVIYVNRFSFTRAPSINTWFEIHVIVLWPQSS
jgi:hypothetical protein